MGIAWDPATSTTTTMNTFLFFSSLIAYASAGTVAVAPVAGVVVGNAAPYLVRAPAHDSASIEHHRLGGNFAYSTAEAHAFAEVIPQISTLTHPVAETSQPQLPPTSLPQLSRPTTLPSPSSRTSLPSEPTRLSTSQLFTKPAPTPSKLFPRLWPPQFTELPMSQLLPFTLPQLLMLLMLLPLLLLDMLVLDMEPVLDMLVLLMEPSPLPQPLLLKQWIPKFSQVPKSDFEWTVPFVCSE